MCNQTHLFFSNFMIENSYIYYWIKYIMHLTNEQISKTYSIIESALNYLFKDYKNSSLVQKNDLSDILQNTMLRILRQKENFEDIKNFKAWCFNAARWELNSLIKSRNKKINDLDGFDVLNTSSQLYNELINIKDIYKISDYIILDDGYCVLNKSAQSFDANQLSNTTLKVLYSVNKNKDIPEINGLDTVSKVHDRLKETGLSQEIDYIFVLDGEIGRVKVMSLLRWDGSSLNSFNEKQLSILAEKLIKNKKNTTKILSIETSISSNNDADQDSTLGDTLENKNLFGENPISSLEKIQFIDCFEKLDAIKRKILTLHIGGLKTEEISKEIEKPRGTVGDHLAKAKMQMYDCIKELD